MSPGQGRLVTLRAPVYNGEDFLAQCIESVLAPGLPEFRVSAGGRR